MAGKKMGGASMPLLARLAMVVGAIGLVAAFFMPWGSADQEFRDAVALAPDVMFYEPVGMTVADAQDISLFSYAQVYGSMGGTWQVYTYISYALLGASALALLLAALGKPIGSSVVAVLAFAGSRLLVWDFGDRGVLPSGTHDWGIAPTIYIVAFVVLVAASAWMFVLRRRAKTQA